jgi:hypothetical protein
VVAILIWREKAYFEKKQNECIHGKKEQAAMKIYCSKLTAAPLLL